jgi:hypothetical protein
MINIDTAGTAVTAVLYQTKMFGRVPARLSRVLPYARTSLQ